MRTIIPVRQKLWDIEYEKHRVKLNNGRAKQLHHRHDLTLEQWEEAVRHFNYACAYCGGSFDLLEHYISVDAGGGTTASNCVPACKDCNSMKDAGRKRKRRFYENPRVLEYLQGKGAKIIIHRHNFNYEGRGERLLGEGQAFVSCECGEAFYTESPEYWKNYYTEWYCHVDGGGE